MPTAVSNITPIHSVHFSELQNVFAGLSRPYGANDIHRFNQVYKRIYGQLSSVERRHAEEWVDDLIAGVERKELASSIFGVV